LPKPLTCTTQQPIAKNAIKTVFLAQVNKNPEMKNLLALLFVFLVIPSKGQQIAPKPDPAKMQGSTMPKSGLPVLCRGQANMKSADLKWKALLTKKYEESEPLSPHQDYIDSIKIAKLKIKQAADRKRNAGKTTSVSPVIGNNFAGNSNSGYSPLDNSMAISAGNQIVSVSNITMAFYDTTGAATYYNSLAGFIGDPTVTGVCDPVVLYDAGSDRFIFFCQEYSSAGLFSNNRVITCYSKTNNPLDGWWVYEMTGDPTGAGDGFDYPKMAVNDSNLFITGNLFYEPATSFHQVVLFQIDKQAGYNGAPLTISHYTGIAGSPFTLLPVSYGQQGSYGPGIYLVSTNEGFGSTINFYHVTENVCCSPVLNFWSVPTTTYSAPGDAAQMGTSCVLRTNDSRTLSGFYLNGIVHFVFTSDEGSGYTGINYNRLSVSSLSNTSSIFSVPGFDCAYPAVASYATTTTDPSVMIGFGMSGATIYPQIDVVNCDSSMSWSSPSVVQYSSNYVSYTSTSVERWGDYTGISRNHSSPTPSVWMSGMYGNTANVWETWIAEIGTPASCMPPIALTATSITATSALLSWSAVAGISVYHIKYRVIGTTTWDTISSITTSVTVTGLYSSSNYEYQLESGCATGSVSSYSSLASFTTLAPGCASPTVFLAPSLITSSSAYLVWEPGSTIAGYNIQYKPIGGATWSFTSSSINSVTLSSLTPGTTYLYEVQSICTGGDISPWSVIDTFTTLQVSGVASIGNTAETKIFPNPISNTFSVEFPLSENANLNISITDARGAIVKELYNGIGTTGENIFSFDKSNLADGVYFLVIKTNDAIIKNEKIVIIK